MELDVAHYAREEAKNDILTGLLMTVTIVVVLALAKYVVEGGIRIDSISILTF